MNAKFEPDLQALADQILHELPDELAGCLGEFELHEGGDALVLHYPLSMNNTLEFQLLNEAVTRYGGKWVNRDKTAQYFLVPRPVQRPKFPAELANEATVQRQEQDSQPVTLSKNIIQAAPAGPRPPIPEPTKARLAEGYQKGAEEDRQIANETTTCPEVAKQPSPLAQFTAEYCMLCEDSEQCNPQNPEYKFNRAQCIAVLDLQEKHALTRELTLIRLTQPDTRKWLSDIATQLEKLANRPIYRGGGAKTQQQSYVSISSLKNGDKKVAVQAKLTEKFAAAKHGLVLELV